MHPRTIAFVGGGMFLGLVMSRLLPSEPATAAVPADPASAPLTRAVHLSRERCAYSDYRMIMIPGTDRYGAVDTGTPEHMQHLGGIAKPEFPE